MEIKVGLLYKYADTSSIDECTGIEGDMVTMESWSTYSPSLVGKWTFNTKIVNECYNIIDSKLLKLLYGIDK